MAVKYNVSRHMLDVTSEEEVDTDSGIEVCDAIRILMPLLKDRYKFGICAGIEPSELEVIMDQYREPVQCLSNIVDRWNRTRIAPSWRRLADVVEKVRGYDRVEASLRRMSGGGGRDVGRLRYVSVPHHKSSEAQEAHSYKHGHGGTATEQSDNTGSEGFLRFECTCGECTVHDHFEGKNCSNKSKPTRYPYLKVRGEPYETDIEIYLEEQTETMRDSFVNLMQDTRLQLQASTTISYGEIQAYVKLLVAGKAEYDAIKNAKNLFELQDALIETCCSWFNNGIIAKIRKNFLHKNTCDEILDGYTNDFNTYCKCRCFESPAMLHLERQPNHRAESKSQALVFKVERDFYTTTLTDVLQVKRSLAKIIRCEPHAINVCTVKEGCTEVHCQVLPAGAIRGITTQQFVELKRLGIVSFRVDGEELLPQSKCLDNGVAETESLSIFELSHSPRLQDRKVFSFTFPSQSSTVQTAEAAVLATSLPADNRSKVICKIVDSERKYVRQLEVLRSGYQPALKEVTSVRDLRLLFPTQLEAMMEKHEELLNKLEFCSYEEDHLACVGEIFARICNSEFLDIYGAYLKEFKVSVKILARCEQNSPKFCEQLSLCQHSFFCEGINLSNYLLLPVQRLPRYELLLKELLKHTPAKHPDSRHIASAIDKLHKGLIKLNHSIKLCLLASSVKQGQNQKSVRFLKSSRRLHDQRYPNKTNIDKEDLLVGDPERRQAAVGRGEEQEYRMKERVPSIPRMIQPSSLDLTRNVSTKSHISIHSSSSATSGIGSMSTCTHSQPDLSIRPISPIEQSPKHLPSVRDSLVSSVCGSVSIRSRSQREKGKSSKDEEGGRPFYKLRGRNISWTNSRMFQLIRYASTADINDLPDGCPSLSSSEESIGGAAAMRQEQDIFDFDYEFLESRRSSVSCSDLLLHCAETPTKHTERDGTGDRREVVEMVRTMSTSTVDSSSSVLTSGIESVTQSQLELPQAADAHDFTQITKGLRSLGHLSTSLPSLACHDHSTTGTYVRTFTLVATTPKTYN